MRYIQQSPDRWVGFSGLEHELCNKVLHADACLSDLDDTDARSPAKQIAQQNWKSRFLSDKAYRRWFLRTGWHYLLNGKSSESARWKEYVDTFLREGSGWNKDALSKVAELLDAGGVERSLFPGVPEFYTLLSADKFYISRNISFVTETYGQRLGFRRTFSEVYQKWEFTEGFVHNHPQYQRYLVRGDSDEDREMQDVLRSKARARKIDYVIGICVTQNRGKNHGFEIETSRNQQELVGCLGRYKKQLHNG